MPIIITINNNNNNNNNNNSVACGAKPASGAPLPSKFGNQEICQEILVVT